MSPYRIDPSRKAGFDVFNAHANQVVAWFAELEDAETFVAIKKGKRRVIDVPPHAQIDPDVD